MELQIKRSPARMHWQVCYNGIVVATGATRREASELLEQFRQVLAR